jgi:hypothetical protein
MEVVVAINPGLRYAARLRYPLLLINQGGRGLVARGERGCAPAPDRRAGRRICGGFAVTVAGVVLRPAVARQRRLGEVIRRRFLGARRAGSWARAAVLSSETNGRGVAVPFEKMSGVG